MNQGGHLCLLNPKPTPQMQEAARSLDSANTEVHPRALIAQVRLPPQPRAPRGPCAGGSTRSPDAAAPPAPAFLAAAPADPARRSPRSSRLHGNQRAAGRPAGFASSGGAGAATSPNPTADPRGVPAARERARPSRPLGAGGRPRDRAGGGDAVTCRGSAASCRRRSPGNRGSDTEAGSRRA